MCEGTQRLWAFPFVARESGFLLRDGERSDSGVRCRPNRSKISELKLVGILAPEWEDKSKKSRLHNQLRLD